MSFKFKILLILINFDFLRVYFHLKFNIILIYYQV